jgi:hypothetical protein
VQGDFGEKRQERHNIGKFELEHPKSEENENSAVGSFSRFAPESIFRKTRSGSEIQIVYHMEYTE